MSSSYSKSNIQNRFKSELTTSPNYRKQKAIEQMARNELELRSRLGSLQISHSAWRINHGSDDVKSPEVLRRKPTERAVVGAASHRVGTISWPNPHELLWLTRAHQRRFNSVFRKMCALIIERPHCHTNITHTLRCAFEPS